MRKVLNISDIDQLLKEHQNKTIAIVTHRNPDGDGLSCAIALQLCLKHIYLADSTIVMDSVFPSFLCFLITPETVISNFKDYTAKLTDKFDLLIVLDCYETDRVDTNEDIFKHAKKVLVIDHHQTKKEKLIDYYHYYIDADAPSTGIIINRFLYLYFTDYDYSWKKEYADCIYTTILNDTDNFLNSNSDCEAFQCASDLFKLGLQPHKITNEFLYKKKISYFKFLGKVFDTIELHGNHKIASFCSNLNMLKETNQTSEAYSKMMRWTKGATDVQLQVAFQEDENKDYRVSLRSDIYDVATIAQHFGGGGHTKAAGFIIKGEYNRIKKEVIDFIECYIT